MLVLLIQVFYDVLSVPDPAPLGFWTNYSTTVSSPWCI
jgi:hypothetical protein